MLLELLRLSPESDLPPAHLPPAHLSPAAPGRQRAEAEGTATEVQRRAPFSEVRCHHMLPPHARHNPHPDHPPLTRT